jgi:competence ComEA-like helix-hairpin-helix protein
MLDRLTPAERRGATVLVLILVLGAAHDGWRAASVRRLERHPVETREIAAPDSVGGPRDVEPAPASAGRLDLNRASVSDLDRLPGIGPVLARRIAEHRASHGPFRRADELLAVRGIGPRLFARIEPRVRVGDPAAKAPAPEPERGPASRLQSAQPHGRSRADSTSVGSAPSR